MRAAGALAPVLRTALRRTFRIGRMFEEAARRHPAATVRLDRPLSVLGSGQTAYGYDELADVVDDLAARLRAAGVGRGEHLPVYKGLNFDLPLLACAAARAGAVPVMLSPALEPAVVLTLLARLSSPWIVTDTAQLARLAGEGTFAGRKVLLTDGPARSAPPAAPPAAPDGVRSEPPSSPDGARPAPASGPDRTRPEPPSGLDGVRIIDLAALAGAPRRPPIDLPPDHAALITHSSGTTGVPKLMVHTTRTLAHRLLPQQLLAWPVRRRARVLLAMSFVHSRFFNSLGVFLSYGNPLAVIGETGLATVRRMLETARPAVVETHPNNFVLWEDFADEIGGPLSGVRYYSSTFDAIHPGTVKRLLSASRHRRPALLQLFGQSETGPLTGWLNTRRNVERMDGRCIGYPLPGFVRLRVVDAAGRPAPRGTIGRLEVRTRGRVRTYLGEEERFRSQLNGGWWYVGDMGWRDRAGRVHLADREVDKISDIDSNLGLEDVLMERLPEISELVIVPDRSGRPTPVLATRHDRPLDPGRWAAAVAGLPGLRDPVQWHFADFPRTSTWKIKRLEIRGLLGTELEPARVPPGPLPITSPVPTTPSGAQNVDKSL
ncbi:AMP-binding protein [Nonomuraea candida]|uniref:AMP-binding protein n=1 Tax=Nonomuraea candida TaxID=359159 RepID=UPI0009FC2C9C|nr:AMP-binding protein [Nonomuraea candida]